MANKIKHLHEVNGRFVVRINVPKPLRVIVFAGKPGTDLKEWLGTDRKAAERAAPEIIARFYRRIDEAKAVLKASSATLGTAAKFHYEAELAADDRERVVGKGTVSLRRLTQSHLATLLRLLVSGSLDDPDEAEALLGDAADAAIAAGAADGKLPRTQLLKALAEARLEAMARQEERDSGKLALSAPSSALLQPEEILTPAAVSARRVAAVSGETVEDILEMFHRERSAGGSRTLAVKTMEEHKVAVRMLQEFLGPNLVARSITTADMRNYKNALLETPANYTKRFPGKSLPQAIEANSQLAEPKPTLSATTINEKWLSHISTILSWAVINGYLDANPARGVKVDLGHGYREPTRVGFSPDDLKRIFGSSLFANPADYQTRQWALLLALYTGARSSSEIARIKFSDIYQEQGIWVFNLEHSSKNVRSKRIVPIHQNLLDLGLLDYVGELQEQRRDKLFYDWEPEDKINRWFLRTYMPQVGIDDDRKVFHSFRHTLKTALARQGVNRDISDLITGHKDQSVGGIYIGDAAITMVGAMRDAINKVAFPIKF
jgi:integrase